ncbi:hypothetical protein MFUL124B02_11390 [Myxococcus fulvus 124B02]|nr:hypothetical protein MFUL124B02_11390 [Myxococcus fulvus 124B02]
MQIDCIRGFLPDIRFTLLLVSLGLAACGGEEKSSSNPTPFPNQGPLAVDDVAATDEDTPLAILGKTLVANDTDTDGDPLVVTDVGMTSPGGAVTLAGGNVTFVPAQDFFGTATFAYEASDGKRGSSATVTVTVRPVNDAPVAVTDSSGAQKDVELLIPVATLLANDKDVDRDVLSLKKVANANSGTAELIGDHVRFVPRSGFVGEAGFEYQVADPDGASATGVVAIRVRETVPTAVVAGETHACAVFMDGRVKCWGAHRAGALGLGTSGNRGDDPNEMGGKLPFVGLGTGQRVTSLDVGRNSTCALLASGAVKCWGGNDWGQLGLGDTEARGDDPGEMDDALPAVDLGTGRTAKSVAVGSGHACAILDDDSVKCWGTNGFGQLGLGNGETVGRGYQPGQMGDALPTVALGAGRTAKALTTGADHTCAVLDDGSLKCWGDNQHGQLGLGDMKNRGTQAREMGDALLAVDLGAGRTAKSVTADRSFTCAVLDDDSVKCWGDNVNGHLGLGDTKARGTGPGEMGDALRPVDLGAGRTAKGLAAGTYSSCALLDDATVKCWGAGFSGSLGSGSHDSIGVRPDQMGAALTPVNLGTGRTAKSVSVGFSYACAILDEGSLKCWGNNREGQLGLGDTADRGDAPGEMGDALLAVEL